MEQFKYNKENQFYWASKKFDKKTCIIMFYKYDKGDYEIENGISRKFSVGFAIGSNRKQVMNWEIKGNQFLNDKITGTGEVKFLIWGKNMLLEFEKFICDKHKNELISISIKGADERRFLTYKHALKKYNYNELFPGILIKLIGK